jgi:hypothetical protein
MIFVTNLLISFEFFWILFVCLRLSEFLCDLMLCASKAEHKDANDPGLGQGTRFSWS